MSDTLLEVKAGPELSSGIFPGLPGEAAALWADGENILFESGQVRKAYGFTILDADTAFAAAPSSIISMLATTERRAIIGAAAKVHGYRTLDDITEVGTGFAAGGNWQFVPWGNWVIGNNQVDVPQIWKHTSSAWDTTPSNLTAVFTTARCIAKFRNYLLAGGTSNGNSLIEHSVFGDPEDFTVTLTGSAGNFEIRDIDAAITAMVPLGEAMGIYTAEDLSWFRFIGGTARFSVKFALESIGALNPHSVVSTGVLNYGITRDFVFVTDGNTFQHIHEPAVKDWLESYVDWTRADEVFGYFDKLNSRVVWYLPMLAGGMKGIAYRTQDRTWTRLNASMVVSTPQGVWDGDLSCDTTNLYMSSKATRNKNGLAVAAFAQSKPLDLGYRRRYKWVDKVVFDIVTSGTVQVAFAYLDNPNDTPTFETAVTMDEEVWLHRETPFLAFKITASAVGSDFKLNGFSVHGSYTGLVN